MPPRLALLPLLLLLGGCFERTQASVEERPLPVQVVKVAIAPAGEARAFAGVVKPRREADIGFRAGGRIIAREVDVGARVTKGQVLARLDPTDLDLAVRSAAADLAAAEAQATQAAADAARSRTLLAQGWTPAATDDAKQASARATREKAIAARSALALATNRRDYAVLTAPADGVITASMADPGTVVADGQPVMRLAEAGALEIEVALPESVAATAATEAGASIWARPDAKLAARLREIAPAADPKLRTYTARYGITDPPAWLALGMTATLHMPPRDATPVASLPAAALADRGQGPMVWVIGAEGGKPEARPVTLAGMRQGRVLVAGLKEGELVVAVGVQKLDPARPVRVADIRPAGA